MACIALQQCVFFRCIYRSQRENLGATVEEVQGTLQYCEKVPSFISVPVIAAIRYKLLIFQCQEKSRICSKNYIEPSITKNNITFFNI